MNRLKSIVDAYDVKQNRIKAKKDKVERLQMQIEKLYNKTHWTDDLIAPVMSIVKETYPNIIWDDKRLIPMGLGAKVSVFGRVQNLPEDSENLISLVFSPSMLGLGFETGEEIGGYARGSMGQMNGFNMKTVEITSVQQVLDYVNKQVIELNNTIVSKSRLEYLRTELRAERISTGELVELQGLIKYISNNDVELLEAAGVPENINNL